MGIKQYWLLAALPLLISATPTAAAGKGAGAERRCGWLVNPTPANFELVDRDGAWTLSAQGGYQAHGMDEMRDMTTAGWVETNGAYGYGCACMSAVVDRAHKRITSFTNATPIPLARCRSDRKLPKPE